MLIWMRNSAFAGVFKFVLLGLLLLAVAGLVLLDLGHYFTGNMSTNTLVKGGGVNVSVVDFDRTLSRVLQRQGIGKAEAYQLGLVDNVLESEIQGQLFHQKARDLGLIVSDDDVVSQIATLAEPLAANGVSKKAALQQILRSQNISEHEFVNSIRDEMSNTLLRQALTPPPTLSSPLLAQSLARYDAERRAVKIIVLKDADIKGLEAPSEDTLKKYYEARKQDFLIPETRTITIATLKPAMLDKAVQVSDEQARAEYEKNIAAYTKPAARVVEQATFQSESGAKEATGAVKGGTPLKTATAAAKGDYVAEQDYEEKGLLPEIATPVFAAKKGDVIGPVKTALGYHVLVLKDIRGETAVPFEKVKDQLKDELKKTALTEQMYQAGNDLEDKVAGGAPLEELVKEYGLTTEILGPFAQSGRNADGKDLFASYASDRDKIIQAAFDYEQGEISSVVETADGQFRLIRVDQVVPDKYRDFASVRAGLEKRWLDEQRQIANKTRAKDALASLNGGKPLADIARQDGVGVQVIAGINRKDKPASPLTPIVGAQIFSTDPGKAFSAEIEGGYAVGVVESVSLPETAPKGEDLTSLEDLTGRTLSQDLLGQYIDHLSGGKDIKINRYRLDELYGKSASPSQAQ